MIEAAPHLLARVASPPVSPFFATRHGDAGVDIITGTSVVEIRHQTDGRQIDADMLVVGIGVASNTDLAA